MASGDGQPLSLRPFPVTEADKQPKSVADFIARINAQPGGFRDVKEADLTQKLREQEPQQQDGDQDDDVDMFDSQEEEEEVTAKDPNVVRIEVARQLDTAGNAAMMALDFLSLLVSKQNPTTASATLTSHLREKVGIGSMGADRLDASNMTPEKTRDKDSIVAGWTMMEISETRDAAQEAARFLEREIAAEGNYWEEVTKVQQSGWSVCKMPNDKSSLGVRFGFSEAAAEFRNQGLAPLRRVDDGAVQLDCGRLGGVPERLVVTYQHNGEVVGRSSTPRPATEDAPLEERVLGARNTIFAQELWHELTREAKSLTAHDVKPDGLRRLTYAMNEATTISIEIVSVEGDAGSEDEPELPENHKAETIFIALRLLLSYYHRHNELMRVRPLPPHIQRSRGQQPYALLRPIIARLQSTQNIKDTVRSIGQLSQALRKAGLASSFVVRTPQLDLAPTIAGPNQPSAPQLLMRSLLQPIEFSVKFTIDQDAYFTVRGRTFTYPITTTNYQIILPPSSPLQTICPPYKDGYPDVRALFDYIRTATSRLLTDRSLDRVTSKWPSTTWNNNIKGTSIRLADRDDFELLFSIVDEGPDEVPALRLEMAPGPNSTSAGAKWTWRPDEGESESQGMADLVMSACQEVVSKA